MRNTMCDGECMTKDRNEWLSHSMRDTKKWFHTQGHKGVQACCHRGTHAPLESSQSPPRNAKNKQKTLELCNYFEHKFFMLIYQGGSEFMW